MTSPIGAVYLAVLPDLSGFGREAARQLSGPVRRASEQAADQAADTFKRNGTEAGRGFGARVASGTKSGFAKLRTLADAAGVGAGAALAAGVSSALDLEGVRAKINAQLGLTGKEAAEAGQVAGSLYAKAYGSSMEEVGDAVTSVVRNLDGMRGASKSALESTTAHALDAAQVLDADVGGVTRAVSQMLRTGLAGSADEAFDIIVKGAQQGADSSGDLLDSLNEYSVQFAKLGLSGTQALGLIRQGLQAGARDSDQISDALKEFTLQAGSGSKPVADAYKALGLNAKQMTAEFGKGGPAAARVLDTVLTRLKTVKDQGDRTNLVKTLFGGPGEDAGAALFALDVDKASTSLGRVQGAADSAGKSLHSTNATEFEAFKRGLISSVRDAVTTYGLPALQQLKEAGAATGIQPSGLVAAGTAVAGVALGAKAVSASYGAARTVVSGTATVIRGAGGAWDSLRLRAMYAGDAARKGGTMVRTAGTSVATAGRAAWSTTTSLGAMTVGWVRSGAAATASAAKQGGAWIANTARAAWSAATSLGAMAVAYARTGLAASASAAQQLVAATATGVVRLAVVGWTAAQWLLNAALAANPVGLVIVGLVALGALFVVLWKRSDTFRAIVLGAWTAIKNGTLATWNAVKGVLLGVFKVIWTVVSFYFTVYKTIILTAWRVISSVTAALWRAGVRDVIMGVLGHLRRGFDIAIRAIAIIWAGLKKAARDPISFVVHTVYGKGLKPIWDGLAGRVGLPKLPDPPKFSTGGVLGGYRPGHDSVLAWLSQGEGVLRPEVVRYLGPAWVHGINRAARSGQLGRTGAAAEMPGFAKGGIVGKIGGAVGGFFKAGRDLFMEGLGVAARKALNPIVSAAEASSFGKTGFGQLVTRLPRKIVDGILSYFDRNQSKWMNKLGGGSVVRVAASQIGQGDRGRENDNKYNDRWGFGPGTAWCANFVSWVLDKAGAGSRYPGYPSAAVAVYSGAMHKVPRDQARPGDLGFYEGGGSSHINIIERNDGGTLTTIGGNEGPVVRRAHRNDQSSVGRPKYATGGVVDNVIPLRPGQREAQVFTRRDEDPGDRRDPLVSLYRKLGPRTAALVSKALANVRPMATGGLVTRPTLALVGEAGPELVTPLRYANGGVVAARKKRETAKERKARRAREKKERATALKQLRKGVPALPAKLNPATVTTKGVKSLLGGIAKQVGKAFTGRTRSRALSTVTRTQTQLLAKTAQRDTVNGRLATARTQLDDLRKARTEFAGNVAGNARQFGALTGLGTVYDASDISARLGDRLTLLRQFTGNLKTLAARGLNAGLLRQLYEAGPEQGGAYAQALVEASAQQLRDINATAGALDSEATRLGEQGGSQFYDAGIRAAEGLVKGLERQKATIEKQMKTIADALVKQLKKSLKIKSPSQVMAEVGRMTAQGFGLGIEQATPAVVQAAAAMTAAPRTLASPPAARTAPAAPPTVRVFIGDRELTDIVRTEIDTADADLVRQLYTRGVA
ncbi:phage tail tape measure protein [Actinomadura litoris]|uniref:phage tail tape measure protein n=1 Tax=Actinomadura litoris TaxID=2678616 RepID=UPI001FA7F7A1|nr:phage tail tape measure protein [Actinomadura litoris]